MERIPSTEPEQPNSDGENFMTRLKVLLFGAMALGLLGFSGQVFRTPPTTTVKADSPQFPKGVFVGKFATIDFKADMTFTVTYEGQIVVKGKYVVKDNQVVLHDKSGPKACVGMDPGTYEWSLDGDKLSFLILDDPCPGRRMMLKDATYVKK